MKQKNRSFSNYQQSLFNKYEIDESYLQTHKQRRACLDLLEKIDKNQEFDERRMIEKVASAFQGSALYKKLIACVTVTALMIALQTTPVMAQATSDYPSIAAVNTAIEQRNDAIQEEENTVVLDDNSFLGYKNTVARAEVKATSLHLMANKALQNIVMPLEENGVFVDTDSDIAYFEQQEVRTLTVIDTDLEDWEIIRDAVNEGEILLLDDDDNPLDTILAKLQEMGTIDCLNIVSHGASGKLKFENGVIDGEALEANKEEWAKIADYMSKDGDIQLFGCNVANGEEGKAFIDKLAQITGADVAASLNPTGVESKGGDWILEAMTGDVAGNLPFAKEGIGKFLGLLLPTTANQITFTSELSGPYALADGGETLNNVYFTVSGTAGSEVAQSAAPMNISNYRAFLDSNITIGVFNIKVSADGTNLKSFELEDINLFNNGTVPFSNLSVTGHKADGSGTVSVDRSYISSGYTFNGESFTYDTSYWNVFNGVQLDYFILQSDTNTPTPVQMFFNSFTVSNMTAPTPTNHEPTLATNAGITVTEGSAATAITQAKLEITDADQAAASISYTLTALPANGTLKNNGVALAINDTFTQADINDSKITYTHNGSETTADSFKFTASDGAGGSIDETTFGITVTPVNDAPVVSTNSALTVTEDATATTIGNTLLNAADPEAGAVTYTLTTAPTKGTLYNNSVAMSTTGTNTFTQADVDGNKITYTPTANLNGADSFTFSVTDGTSSLTGQTFNIDITSVNDEPTLATNAGITVAEGSAATAITQAKLEITDADQAASAITYTLTALPTNGTLYKDSVELNTTTNNTFTQADINSGKITYTHNGSETTSDSFTFTASDGDGGSVSSTSFAITVTPVNDAPVVSTNSALTVTEDATATTIGNTLLNTADPEAGTVTYMLTTAPTKGTLYNNSVAMSTTGTNTFTQADIDGNKITYTPTANLSGADSFTFSVTDGTSNLTGQTFNIDITSVNDEPTLATNAGITVTEGSAATAITQAKLEITDADQAAASISYTLTAAPANGTLYKDSVELNTTTNNTFTQADINSGKITYTHNGSETTSDSFTFTASDGDGGSVSSTSFAITVTSVNDAPVVSTNSALTVTEDATATTIANTLLDTADPEAGAVTYTLTTAPTKGTLYNNSVAMSTTGTNTFTQADIDGNKITYTPIANLNGADSFTFSVTDGTSSLTGQTFNIDITSVNDEPTLATNAGITVAEGSAATAITQAKLEITDADQAAASISYTLTAAPANGTLYKDSVELNTTTNNTFTQADINSGKITYTHNGSETTSDSFTFTASDGDGGSVSSTSFAITVTPVNDAPVVSTNSALTVTEDATATTIGNTLLNTADPEAGTVTYTLTTAPTKGTLYNNSVAMSTTGTNTFTQADIDGNKITYTPTANANGSDSFNFSVTDGTSSLTGQTFNLSITAVNDAPSITSATTVNFTEGGTGTAYTATANDPEGDAITWSLTGTDAAQFIMSSSGAITFKTAPSFADPKDNDKNNSYIMTITASDGGLTTSSALTINVVQKSSGGGSSSGGSSSGTGDSNTGANVIVNGKTETAGNASNTTVEGKNVTTITVDDTTLNKILDEKGSNATVTIPSTNGADVTVGVLNGQTVKNMEEKATVLEIKTQSVTYTLPAAEISIDDVSTQFGQAVQLKDIKISISVAEPPANTVRIVEDTANKNSYQIIVKPVEFEITCTSGSKTVNVSRFNGYVERTVAIPDGVDPSKITTGIVLNSDGTFSHVPTAITSINGKYYAKINSLTNSTYSVIYNPVAFADVSKHWAKDSINDMGSRLVISGVDGNNFEPNRDITRAEFAAIVVRALGLAPDATKNTFDDVAASKWYSGYVGTATSYGIISGYNANTFRPNDKITREQAMTMIARSMKLTGIESTLTESEVDSLLAEYTDANKTSSYAKTGIASCLNANVVSGREGSIIAPKNYITRAEVAVIVERLLKKSKLI